MAWDQAWMELRRLARCEACGKGGRVLVRRVGKAMQVLTPLVCRLRFVLEFGAVGLTDEHFLLKTGSHFGQFEVIGTDSTLRKPGNGATVGTTLNSELENTGSVSGCLTLG